MYSFYDSIGYFGWTFYTQELNNSQSDDLKFLTFYYKYNYISEIDPLWSYYVVYKEHSYLNTFYCMDLFSNIYKYIFINKCDFTSFFIDVLRYIIYIFLNFIWLFVSYKYKKFITINNYFKGFKFIMDIIYYYDLKKTKILRYIKK